MHLEGKQQRQLEEILLGAFPTKSVLTRMVRHGLDENLSAISAGENLQEVVFDLIEWARTHDRVADLIRAGLESNPDYSRLSAFAEQTGLTDVFAENTS